MVFTSDRGTDLETLQTLRAVVRSQQLAIMASDCKMTGTHYFKMTKGQQL